jgi:hypothetical protein
MPDCPLPRRVDPRRGGQAAPWVRVVAQVRAFGAQPGDGLGPVRNGPAFLPCKIKDVRAAAEDAAAVDGGPRQEIHRRNAGEPGDTQLGGAIVDCRRRARLPVIPARITAIRSASVGTLIWSWVTQTPVLFSLRGIRRNFTRRPERGLASGLDGGPSNRNRSASRTGVRPVATCRHRPPDSAPGLRSGSGPIR